MNKSLYRLTNELAFLEQLTMETDENSEAMLISQTEIIEMVKHKTDNVADYFRYLQDRVDAAKVRAKQLKEIAEADERRIEKLEAYVLTAMDILDVKSLAGNDSTFKKKSNPPSLKITNEDLIPLEFIKVKVVETISVDKKAVLDRIKSGEVVSGCEIQQLTRLEIK